MSAENPAPTPEWLRYEAGRPEGIEDTIKLLVDEIIRLKHVANLLLTGDDEKPNGGKSGEKPTPRKDNAEEPDTNPGFDAKNFKAKVRAVRTDADGNYQGAQLEALEEIEKPKIPKGGLFRLRNKNWENEFKRAQSAGKIVCLSVRPKTS